MLNLNLGFDQYTFFHMDILSKFCTHDFGARKIHWKCEWYVVNTAPPPSIPLRVVVGGGGTETEAQDRGLFLPWTSAFTPTNFAWSFLLFLLFCPLPKVWVPCWKDGSLALCQSWTVFIPRLLFPHYPFLHTNLQRSTTLTSNTFCFNL